MGGCRMGAVTGESNHVFGDRGSLVQQPVDSTPNRRTTVTAGHEWNHMCVHLRSIRSVRSSLRTQVHRPTTGHYHGTSVVTGQAAATHLSKF